MASWSYFLHEFDVFLQFVYLLAGYNLASSQKVGVFSQLFDPLAKVLYELSLPSQASGVGGVDGFLHFSSSFTAPVFILVCLGVIHLRLESFRHDFTVLVDAVGQLVSHILHVRSILALR